MSDDVYEELSFISPDPRVFSEKLREVQNPTLARRIRILTLWPTAVRQALLSEDQATTSETLRREGQTPPPPSSMHHNQYSIFSIGRLYVDKLFPKRSLTGNGPSPSSPSQEERLEMFRAVLQSLINLEEFNINWYFDKGVSAWKFSLFSDIWRSIRTHNLRRLSIDTYMHKMDDIVSYAGSLTKLEHLHLTLRCEAHDIPTNHNFVPYFINKLAPTLRSISFKTIGHQDLSFFKLLVESFPHLIKLSLAMPFDSHHLKDSSGLRQLLKNHPKLQELSLRHQFCCGNTPQAKDAHRNNMGNYDIYKHISLPKLRSLEFGLNMPLSREKTSLLMKSVGAFGQSITSLSLMDHSLTLDELKIMLESFPSQRLKKLSLFARLLTPQLVDAIAQFCPILNSLTLDVQSIAKSEWQSNNDVEAFTRALLDYAVDLDNGRWRYRTWTLSDIAVLKWEFQVGHQYDIVCMKVIASVVPTVRSFAGKGYMCEELENVFKLKPETGQLLDDLENRMRLYNDT